GVRPTLSPHQDTFGTFSPGQNPDRRILAEVRPLAVDYAERLWQWVFPTDKDVLPLVAKDKKDWLQEVFGSQPIWFGLSYAPLSMQLRRHFSWAEPTAAEATGSAGSMPSDRGRLPSNLFCVSVF